jgi:hypothetical protein
VITITVPFDVFRCSPNRYKRNWAAKAREAKAARTTARLMWRSAGEPRMSGPVDVTLIIRRGRRLDHDGALACCKHALDGLFNDAITPFDTEKWVRYVGWTQETSKAWALRPEVVVTITPREVEAC